MLHDMIERIEHFAQVQADFPVYNILGDVHTYGDLKADSDALATYIDFLKIEEKSPVLVFGGQEYEMLASFVGLTNQVMLIFQLTNTPPLRELKLFWHSRAKLDYCRW